MKTIRTLWVVLILTTPLCADEYDTLRARWHDMLVSYSPLTTSDPDIADKVRELADDANSIWAKLDPTNTTELIEDLPLTSGTTFENNRFINITYSRLRIMALAWATSNCVASDSTVITGNTAMLADLKDALDVLESEDYYSENTSMPAKPDRSRFYVAIKTPLLLHDICVLLYDELSTTQLEAFTDATVTFINWDDIVEESGGNKVWIDTNHALYGVLRKDSTKLAFARDYLSEKVNHGDTTPSVFAYIDWTAAKPSGFFADGSFVQHEHHPYTGGYGSTLLQNLSKLLVLLNGSTWDVTDPDADNVYHWVYDQYWPTLYRGAVMDNLRGREISRKRTYDHVAGHTIMEGILHLSTIAPEPHASNFKAMIQNLLDGDSREFSIYAGYAYDDYEYSESFFVDATLPSMALALDYSGTAEPEQLGHYDFPSMNRVMHRRPGWGFGLSLFSDRIWNYESLQPSSFDDLVQNKRGYFTGNGMTTLYTSDQDQFSEEYWPTINPSRIPGITVDTLARHDASSVREFNGSDWAGGASLEFYGVAGLDFVAPDHTWESPDTMVEPDVNEAISLTARKSWFMFDDEVVALGADIDGPASSITSGGWDGLNPRIETVIENRRLDDSGLNVLRVNNSSVLTSFSSDENGSSFTSTTRAHLAGNETGDDIGYYFPTAVNLHAARFARVGSWEDIIDGANDNDSNGDPIEYTRNYLSLWLDHGASPSNDTYAYVLLPGKSSTETESYVSSPEISVVQNNATAQVVEETDLDITAATLWVDSSSSWLNSLVKADKKAAIIIDRNSRDLEIGVSDPTFAYTTGSTDMTVEINDAATAILYLDPDASLVQATPTIKFTVPLVNSFGRTFRARFLTGADLAFVDTDFDSDTTSSPPSGWNVTAPTNTSADVENFPGSGDLSVKIDDNSSSDNAVLAHTFGSTAEPQNGAILAEYRLRPNQTNVALDAGALRDDSDIYNSAIGPRIIFRSTGVITYYDGTTAVDSSISYSANTWYRFRLLAVPATQRYSLWVDDQLVVRNAAFWSEHSNLDRITFGTVSASQTGAMHVDDVTVRRYSPLFADDFVNQTPGLTPENWTVAGASGSKTVEIAVLPDSTTDTGLLMDDGDSGSGIYTTAEFYAQAGPLHLRYRIRPAQSDAFIKAGYLREGSDNAIQVYFTESGDLLCNDGTNSTTLVSNYPADEWYYLEIEADPSSDTATVTCRVDTSGNGVLETYSAAVDFYAARSTVDNLLFGIDNDSIGSFYVDEVSIYR